MGQPALQPIFGTRFLRQVRTCLEMPVLPEFSLEETGIRHLLCYSITYGSGWCIFLVFEICPYPSNCKSTRSPLSPVSETKGCTHFNIPPPDLFYAIYRGMAHPSLRHKPTQARAGRARTGHDTQPHRITPTAIRRASMAVCVSLAIFVQAFAFHNRN